MADDAPARLSADWPSRVLRTLRGRCAVEVGGALLSLLAAILLYTRFSLMGRVSRDEAIYAYGGERMARGTPPYESIFDPKGPMATIISGIAASLGRAFGFGELYAIRRAFFVCAVLSVVAVYLLVLHLGRSVLAALAAATVFVSFEAFARDALPGPDAKTPGVLFLVLAMWLAARRWWFWSGVFGMLAFLIWQPLVIYPVIAVVAAYLLTPDARWRAALRALLGLAFPFLAVCTYFLATGAFGKFVEAAFQFPIQGVQRGKDTLPGRLHHIGWVVYHYNGVLSAVLAWLGVVVLLGIAVRVVLQARPAWRTGLLDPVVLIVFFTLLAEAGYATTDFQSYPDLYPLLPYPAIGLGLALAYGLRKLAATPNYRIAVALTASVALALAAVSWVRFTDSKADNTDLHTEWATGCAVNQIVVPGTSLYSLGDPVPLVMTRRRNPDRYVYLGSGVAEWKIKHTHGGLGGWEQQIRDSGASVIVIHGWDGDVRDRIGNWLVANYRRGYVGQWRVFLTDEAWTRLSSLNIRITPTITDGPQRADGSRFTTERCGNR
jgi:hypothetical protein